MLTMAGDSMEGLYETLRRCALISKTAGGIGLNVHCIRAAGSYIAGVRRNSLKRKYLLFEQIWGSQGGLGQYANL